MNHEEYARMFAVEQDHFWYRGMRAVCDSLLGPVAAQAPALRILDAGCGTGGNALWLARRGAVTACDFSPEALRFCRQRGLPRLLRASVCALPCADASFDLVTSFEVLEHRAVEREAEAVAELYRVLVPGGRLLLRLPAFRFLLGPHDDATHGLRRYRLAEVVSLLEGAGFVVRHATYANALLWPVAVAWRLWRRLGHRQAPAGMPAAASDVRPLPRLADSLLGFALAAEAHLVPRFRLPVGLSVLALAERPTQ